jgi:hypothetical protein
MSQTKTEQTLGSRWAIHHSPFAIRSALAAAPRQQETNTAFSRLG